PPRSPSSGRSARSRAATRPGDRTRRVRHGAARRGMLACRLAPHTGAPPPPDEPPAPADAQATFAATLVDEWVRCGLRHAVVCPGSRSTPLALALSERPEGALQVHHGERSGAFLAPGPGLPTRRPAVVLTTSGTAAAELHAAVVEADLAGVPLLACTADRP